MRPQLLDLLAQLSSVQRFVQAVAEDAGNARSVLVLLPVPISADAIWSLVDRELWRRRLSVDSVDLTSYDVHLTPAEIVGEACHVGWLASSARDIASLLQSEGLPNVIVLEGIETLAPSARNTWIRFISRWAELSQNMPTATASSSALCAMFRPSWSGAVRAQDDSFVLPDSNVKLRIHWWWGFPSALEIKLLCRLAALESGEVSTPGWYEYFLPALVGTDVSLLDRLWVAQPSGNDVSWMTHLREVAEERGWTNDRLKECGAAGLVGNRTRRNGTLSPEPPPSLRALWAQGLVYATDEYGIELHPAALLALGRYDELERRLWREQAGFLFPVLDSIRLDICNYLTERYGKDWPVKWAKPERSEEEEEVRKDPLACQWGYLEWLIRSCNQLARERRWLELISSATAARNAIAHYRTVSQRDYEHILEQYGRFVDTVSG